VQEQCDKISTTSLPILPKKGRTEELVVSTISGKPFEDSKGSPKIELPHKYTEFIDVFDKEKANILHEHRRYDCPIDHQPGQEPQWGPIYSLSPTELEVLQRYID
jgi:hypothetical protein